MRVVLLGVVLSVGCGKEKAVAPSGPAAVPAPSAPASSAGSAAALAATAGKDTTAPSPAAAAGKDTTPPSPTAAAGKDSASRAAGGRPSAAGAAAPPLVEGGRDFTADGAALLAVGACGGGALPEGIATDVVARHCDVVIKARTAYADGWVAPARAFFAQKVPADAPKRVVYPFAGADLSTALTVFPDADEITTLSLEPAGDPRTLATLRGKALDAALAKVQYELKFLYRVNFSNTMNMIEAMRGGALPVQLIFGLSALELHGYELVKLRYFRLEPSGAIRYLDDDDVARAPDPVKARPEQRNFVFANAEVLFRKPAGRVQVWRHIRANLGDATGKGIGPGLEADGRVVKHLEAKGRVAGMTKAASYLLSWETFALIRNYLLAHVVWMVSDATGVAPKWGKAAGYEYETYGNYVGPHIPAGLGISKDWIAEFKAQPSRPLAFRFGYYDKKLANHLVIMRRKT